MSSNEPINIFSRRYVLRLLKDVDSEIGLERYNHRLFPYSEKFAPGSSGIFMESNFDLNIQKSDLENSICLYKHLALNETQASDSRLWCYMAHVKFWRYMLNRWPIDLSSDSANRSRIKSRYFLESANLEKLSRNGISRLWWYSKLTFDDSRKDKFELTKVMLSRQDLVVGITEREIGTNKRTRFAILEYLKMNEQILKNEDNSREFMKRVNLAAGIKNLTILKHSELLSLFENLSNDLK